MLKIKRRRGQRKISAWSQSAEFKAVARASLAQINSTRHFLPKCSAMAKSTGERCKHLAMGNGKCRVHGGKTPKGDQWHVLQADVSGVKNSMARFDAKLTKAQKARRAKQVRLRNATEAERIAYEKWLWSHPAGSAARRSERRVRRLIAAESRELSAAAKDNATNPEIAAIEARLAELRRHREWLKSPETGVFG